MDKRKYRRLDTDFLVRIRHISADEKAEAAAISRIENLSLGGVFIATATPLLLNRIVELEFQVPGYSDIVRAKGIVRWSKSTGDKQGMGIEFLEVSIPSKVALNGYVVSEATGELARDLTRTDAHRALLKVTVAHWGDRMSRDAVVALVNQPLDDFNACLEDFAKHGVVSIRQGAIEFVAPIEEGVVKALEEFVKSGFSNLPGGQAGS
ncbi:MAG: PilZ domain-containing protein [Planctomycetota bacterium]|nr:PilZ domain-containing protein [Planctomycetota bacterium]